MAGVNCWEFKRCGREEGGADAGRLGVCPAYPHDGHRCSRVAGTLSGGPTRCSGATGDAGCLRCDFFLGPYHDKPHPYGAGGGQGTRFAK